MTKLFFSYSHKDEVLRDTLQIHLEMLRRSGAVDTIGQRLDSPFVRWRFLSGC